MVLSLTSKMRVTSLMLYKRFSSPMLTPYEPV
jgi:hypothetical protein